MRYHNITKDDMLNGDVCVSFYGLQDATIVVKTVKIRLPGIQMVDWNLMKRQKQNCLKPCIMIIFQELPLAEEIPCFSVTEKQ